ncbi:hypothetical protein HMPREF0972_02643 [Actinomyces sp. oral taxon 848 str. F0332]|nr:hypothetical protein HMPREF0972_02643 [Actinomyces sp. oral taxon 848 str. F0332]
MLARGHIRIAKSPDKDDVGAGRLRHSGDRQYGATPDVDVVGLGARAQLGDDVAVRASKRPLQGSGDVWIRFGQNRSNQQIHRGATSAGQDRTACCLREALAEPRPRTSLTMRTASCQSAGLDAAIARSRSSSSRSRSRRSSV